MSTHSARHVKAIWPWQRGVEVIMPIKKDVGGGIFIHRETGLQVMVTVWQEFRRQAGTRGMRNRPPLDIPTKRTVMTDGEQEVVDLEGDEEGPHTIHVASGMHSLPVKLFRAGPWRGERP